MDRRSALRQLAASTYGALALPGVVFENELPQEQGVPRKLELLRKARWSEERAFQYMDRLHEVKGCNYVPSDGSSVLSSPNVALLRRELGWASEVVGLNCVRIWVELAEFEIDPDRLYASFESFLGICHENGIRVLPVLSLQSMLDPDASVQEAAADQPTLRFQPSVHGGGYRHGHRIGWPCCDPDRTIPARVTSSWDRIQPTAERFFRSFLKRYGKDDRILLWDLYNEAPRAARPIVETIFEWAREEAPSQPLSVCWQGHDLSDVITFHTYSRPGLETSNRTPMGWDFLNELDWLEPGAALWSARSGSHDRSGTPLPPFCRSLSDTVSAGSYGVCAQAAQPSFSSLGHGRLAHPHRRSGSTAFSTRTVRLTAQTKSLPFITSATVLYPLRK